MISGKRSKSNLKELKKNIKSSLLDNYKLNDNNQSFYIYSKLLKELKFQNKFDKFDDKLQFKGKLVKSFGLLTDKYYKEYEITKNQIKIIDYKSDNDFIIKLITKTDEIYLMKLNKITNINEMISNLEMKIIKSKEMDFSNIDNLVIPLIDFKVRKEYDDIEYHSFKNKDFEGYIISLFLQDIIFHLNSKGAKLDSQSLAAMDATSDLSSNINQPKPKNLIFDNSFLLYIKQKNAIQPYLIVLFNNDELFLK